MNSIRQQLPALMALVVGAVSLAAQTNSSIDLAPFAGTWKEDLSKTVRSANDNDIRRYEQNPDGLMSVTVGTGANAHHDTFRVDGKPYPVTPRPSETQIWTHPGEAIWESTVTEQGKVLYSIRRTVSSDGARLTYQRTAKSNQGQNVTQTTTYERISAEKSGLVGTWKPLSDKVDTPDVLSFRVSPDGTLSASSGFLNYEVKPDGKPYPASEDSVAVSLTSPADRTLEFTFYTNAKAFEIDTLTVSADRRVLNETDRDPETNKQKAAIVYRKQP